MAGAVCTVRARYRTRFVWCAGMPVPAKHGPPLRAVPLGDTTHGVTCREGEASSLLGLQHRVPYADRRGIEPRRPSDAASSTVRPTAAPPSSTRRCPSWAATARACAWAWRCLPAPRPASTAARSAEPCARLKLSLYGKRSRTIPFKSRICTYFLTLEKKQSSTIGNSLVAIGVVQCLALKLWPFPMLLQSVHARCQRDCIY